MIATMETPDSRKHPAALAPWETDPDAWKGADREEQEETQAAAVARLLEELAVQ